MNSYYCDPIDEITEYAKSIINAQNQGLLGEVARLAGMGQADALSTITSAITSAASIATDYYLKKEALKTQEEMAELQAQTAAAMAAQRQPAPAPATASIFGGAGTMLPVAVALGLGAAYIFMKGRRRRW